MATLQRCTELLDRSRVKYTHTRHANAYRAREVAEAEHVPPYKLAKTIIFCGDDFYAMAVLRADCLLDLDELESNLGLARLRLATESEIVNLFPGCEVGAMPPIGQLFDLPVYLDERLAQEKHIVFSAGTHRDAIHMRMEDYLLLAEPLITRFAYLESGICRLN
jgi:Ala-tRNA(Pro) deacylase